MFRMALGYVLGTDNASTSKQVHPTSTMEVDQHEKPCFFLDKLPPEIRIQIYEYLIRCENRLVPCKERKRGASNRKLEPLDLSILQLNKQIYAEAADHFYKFNKFATYYEDFCSCWSGKHVKLDKAQIKNFRILRIDFDEDYHPQLWDRCRVCDTQGFWLIKHLNTFPKLESVRMVFDDVESFAVCLSAVSRKIRKLGSGASLLTDEIGSVIITGAHTQFFLRQNTLISMWPIALAKASEPWEPDYDSDDDDDDWPSGHWAVQHEPMYLALRDILYYAITISSTTEELQPLMRKIISPAGLHVDRLDSQEKADFTIGLAGCLADIIADDGNVHMADRRDLVTIAPADQGEKNGRSRASSAVSRRAYSYMTRF